MLWHIRSGYCECVFLCNDMVVEINYAYLIKVSFLFNDEMSILIYLTFIKISLRKAKIKIISKTVLTRVIRKLKQRTKSEQNNSKSTQIKGVQYALS